MAILRRTETDCIKASVKKMCQVIFLRFGARACVSAAEEAGQSDEFPFAKRSCFREDDGLCENDEVLIDIAGNKQYHLSHKYRKYRILRERGMSMFYRNSRMMSCMDMDMAMLMPMPTVLCAHLLPFRKIRTRMCLC